MSLLISLYRHSCKKSDTKRDKKLKYPRNVHILRGLNYYEDNKKCHEFDLFTPNDRPEAMLPVIVVIHGGGYVYGNKELYQFYSAYLASQGFAVICFNYTLAPKAKFPTQLEEINQVFTWMSSHNERYYLDLDNLFAVGDSAGAQLLSQYAAIATNKEYENLFNFKVPTSLQFKAIGLNCGLYDAKTFLENEESSACLSKALNKAYFGKHRFADPSFIKQIDVMANITKNYPPVSMISGQYDFLKDQSSFLDEFLTKNNIEHDYRFYGKEGEKQYQHVFHVNMGLKEAYEANENQLAFFRSHFSKNISTIKVDVASMLDVKPQEK